MNTSIAQFMKIALTVVVIAGLLFVVGYKMIDSEITDTSGGYQKSVTDVGPPAKSGPGSR